MNANGRRSGLTSLSEIVFDKGHRHAVVGYGDDLAPRLGPEQLLFSKKLGTDGRSQRHVLITSVKPEVRRCRILAKTH